MAGTFAVSSVDQAGDIGGNGISRFSWVAGGSTEITPADANAMHNALHAFYTELAQILPSNMTYAIQPTALVHDVDSGVLVSEVPQAGSTADVKGLGIAGGYAGGSGGRINWHTGVVINGRRLRGATFVVPLHSGAYAGGGGLSGNTQAELIAAAGHLNDAVQAASLALVVYHRPAKGATVGGGLGAVSAWTVGTTPASLRSRRT